jgi:hypothetical protein
MDRIRGRSELQHVKPERVNLKARRCWVKTGKKGKPRELLLNDEGVAAWKEFIAINAWGTYQKDRCATRGSVRSRRRTHAGERRSARSCHASASMICGTQSRRRLPLLALISQTSRSILDTRRHG